MKLKKYIGIDLGGTNVRAGVIFNDQIISLKSSAINSTGSTQEVLRQIFDVIEGLDMDSVAGIGIGVPSVVDIDKGIVYDVQNIPSWKEVPIKKILEERYNIPTKVNNDANCFALAEKHFGKGVDHASLIGLIMGTGLAVGIIINGQIYEGSNCGAGEFGMIKYLDHHYEYYCSGQYFDHTYGISGEELYKSALAGNHQSLEIFRSYGIHLGHAIQTIMYAYDPQLIVMGGSVSKAFQFYQESLNEVLASFAYQKSIDRLKIRVSEIENPGVLGAAGLHY